VVNQLHKINNKTLVSNYVMLKMSVEMKAISRRHFLQVAGATMLVAVLPAIGGGRNHRGVKRVRVRKLEGQGNISNADRAFYHRARFATPADAMRAVASRRMTAEIYME
jgi:hypothetical protein